jgi:hypothetical protein
MNIAAGAYPIVEHLKKSSIGQVPALPANIRPGWEGLPGTNTSLLLKFVNNKQKSFVTLGPGENVQNPFSLATDAGAK